ncbi:MAG: hypothetical protein BWK80_00225 [Desulfobacteraceae bacterium IS3]|nr:MAG: hypothetical protein BWK80_00225 [Desulfobacteraceae bacterium IS3]
MNDSESIIKVIGEDNCPVYKINDEFKLSGKSLFPPQEKPVCLILAGDIMAALIKFEGVSNTSRSIFDCSGCSGLIRFEYIREKTGQKDMFMPLIRQENYIGAVVNLLGSFSIFKNLNEEEIKDIVSFLRLDKFDRGDIILKKGEPGKKLFIIISGKVEVLIDNEICIAILEKGEIFGEMSLLSGEPVVATIRVLEPAKVLYLNGEYFRKILNRFPPLQIYLASLLARRLARANTMRLEDVVASGIVGKLSEIPPSGLFQTFNLNQKTGTLFLELPRGIADLSFRDGEIVSVNYNEKQGRDAFFELLKEKDGRFKFIPGLSDDKMNSPKLGNFMGLLMEGIKRIDECDFSKLTEQ